METSAVMEVIREVKWIVARAQHDLPRETRLYFLLRTHDQAVLFVTSSTPRSTRSPLTACKTSDTKQCLQRLPLKRHQTVKKQFLHQPTPTLQHLRRETVNQALNRRTDSFLCLAYPRITKLHAYWLATWRFCRWKDRCPLDRRACCVPQDRFAKYCVAFGMAWERSERAATWW